VGFGIEERELPQAGQDKHDRMFRHTTSFAPGVLARGNTGIAAGIDIDMVIPALGCWMSFSCFAAKTTRRVMGVPPE
jgi:hypothetical protein